MTQLRQRTVLGAVSHCSLFRAGLRSVAEELEALEVIEAEGLEELEQGLRRVGCGAPDLLVVEFRHGSGDPLQLAVEARSRFPVARIVLMIDVLDFESMARCFAAGLDGYLLHDIGRRAFADSLRLVQLGEKVFPSRLATVMQEHLRRRSDPQLSVEKLQSGHLSAREAEILSLLVTGEPNKLIARRLKISEATVKVHMKSILRKTRARNRTEAALWALTPGNALAGAAAH